MTLRDTPRAAKALMCAARKCSIVCESANSTYIFRLQASTMTKKERRRRVLPTADRAVFSPVDLGRFPWSEGQGQEGLASGWADLVDIVLDDANAAIVASIPQPLKHLLGGKRVRIEPTDDAPLVGIELAGLCIPRKLDTDSTANWTPIPREPGQSERSDAGLKGFTLRLGF
jgi:hypothetical protein